MPESINNPKVLRIFDLLRPHWKAMVIALGAVAGEAITDLLEPWPIKIVFDYVLQSRQLPGWMIMVVGWIGEGKLAVLSFALAAVAAIAIAGAASSYLETQRFARQSLDNVETTLLARSIKLTAAGNDQDRHAYRSLRRR